VGGRGRRAALPNVGYQPPARLLLDDGRCLARFTTEDGRASKEFDFTRLPVSRELQVAFAWAFDRRTGPSGTRKAVTTADGTYYLLRRFSTYLAGLARPPAGPAELVSAHLDGYLLTRRKLRTLDRETNLLTHTLRAVEGLSGQFTAKLLTDADPARRTATLHSYSQAEFSPILAAARHDARAAAQRIRMHRELLARWRAGQVGPPRRPGRLGTWVAAGPCRAVR